MDEGSKRRVRAHVRWARGRVKRHASTAGPPPPEAHRSFDALLWGLVQPWIGLQRLLRNRSLLKSALWPACLMLGLCAMVGLAKAGGDPWRGVETSFFTLIAMSPVPPVLFGRHYARLAARAQSDLELGPREPYLRSRRQYLWESLAQLLVIGMGLAPLSLLLGLIPGVGAWWALLIGGLWAMHWMVIEAFDMARTLQPGSTVAQTEARLRQRMEQPWFVRLYRAPPNLPRALAVPWRAYGTVVHRLARHWDAEAILVERHPWIAAGFSVGTTALLAIPGLNLLFRPAVVVAAGHVRAHLEPPLAAGDVAHVQHQHPHPGRAADE